MAIAAGQTILNGKYRTQRLIGEGAFARVWLAEDTLAKRQVAIKEPKQDMRAAIREEVERRCQQESELAASLAQVPYVIHAFTIEKLEDGVLILVMEYAEGGSVAELIAQHPNGLPLEGAVTITTQLCQALERFHATPLLPVHRDIKPSNILLTAQGKARLADFGLAQLPGVSNRSQLGGGPHPCTPLYAAPEQLRSPEPLLPSADLFALGCVLWEMLTGQPYKRQRPDTKPSARRSDTPAWLDRVVMQALAEDPWERWQSAGDMATALARGSAQAEAEERAQRDAEANRQAEEQARLLRQREVEAAARVQRQADEKRQAEEQARLEAQRQADERRRAEAEARLLKQREDEAVERAQREQQARAAVRVGTGTLHNERPVRRERNVPAWALIGLGAAAMALLVLGVAAVGPRGNSTPIVVAVQITSTPATEETVKPGATETLPTATPLPPKVTDTPTPSHTATPLPPKDTDTPTPTYTADGVLRLELAPGVTLELVRVPAGEFLMGSDKAVDPEAQDDELPQHRLNLAEYWIGKTEVTNGQFAAFVAATSYKTTAEQEGSGYVFTGSDWEDVKGASWQQPSGPGSDVKEKANHPVVLVSWHDAVAFGQWVSQVTGRTVRLPSEAEWEKAARGMDGRIFPWGNTWDGARVDFCDQQCDGSWKDASVNDGYRTTAPVGTYTNGVSPYGAFDLAGNVWEWVSSKYGSYPYRPNDGREDRSSTDGRVLRGGSWNNEAWDVRPGDRGRLDPGRRVGDVGFRVASPGL